jgi:hypothetical protein
VGCSRSCWPASSPGTGAGRRSSPPPSCWAWPC